MNNKSFCTSLGCMDGRPLLSIVEFAKAKFGVDYVDYVTDAGIVEKIANPPSENYLSELGVKVNISADKHGSENIIVWGHQKCAGDPVEDSVQKDHVRSAAEAIKKMRPQANVVTAFVVEDEPQWKVEEL